MRRGESQSLDYQILGQLCIELMRSGQALTRTAKDGSSFDAVRTSSDCHDEEKRSVRVRTSPDCHDEENAECESGFGRLSFPQDRCRGG